MILSKRSLALTLLSFSLFASACSQTDQEEPLNIERVVLDATDSDFGYYLSVVPAGQKPSGVLVLLPGFSQKSEDVFLDTEIPQHAYANNLLTIAFAGKMRMTADAFIQKKLSAVLEDVLKKYSVSPTKFVLGGFSAGGVIALRYTELCNQYPEQFPIQPLGVFMADSPVDLFHLWGLLQELVKNNNAQISVNEARWMEKFYREHYGATPSEDPELFKTLSPFSINPELGQHEQYLKNVAVRSYHDVDINWRLINRNQTARFENYVAASELINRLMLLGNDRAEFMQSFRTGYRRDGRRHPHSWSIIDAPECISWVLSLLD